MLTYKADTIHKVCTVSKRTDRNTGEIYSEINFSNFVPGSVITFHVSHTDEVAMAIASLQPFINDVLDVGVEFEDNQEKQSRSPLIDQLIEIISKLNLLDMNSLLYRSEPEEKDANNGRGVYNIPNYGSLSYCGVKGWIIFILILKINF